MTTKKLKLDELMTRILDGLEIGYELELLDDIRAFREEWGLTGKTVKEVAEELGLAEAEVFRWCQEVVGSGPRGGE